MAPRLGLVKDKLGKVLSVVLHERDQMRLNDMPAGYRLFVPEYMAKGIWVQLQNCKRSPLSAHIMPDAELQGSVFIELHNANFKCDININGAHETVEGSRYSDECVGVFTFLQKLWHKLCTAGGSV